MKFKYPKFYKQIELLKIKEELPKRIKKTEAIIKESIINNDVDDFISFSEYRDKLVKDQLKIKLAISKNNFFIFINQLIYKREEIAKKLEFLKFISKNKELNEGIFFSTLKSTKNFVIENVIQQLQKKLQNIEKRQKRINNSFLTNSLLILETV